MGIDGTYCQLSISLIRPDANGARGQLREVLLYMDHQYVLFKEMHILVGHQSMTAFYYKTG